MRLGQKVVALESAVAAEGERIIASLESIQIDFQSKTEVVSVESRGKLFKGRQTVTVSTEGFFEVIGDIIKAIVDAFKRFFNWLFGSSSSSSGSSSSVQAKCDEYNKLEKERREKEAQLEDDLKQAEAELRRKEFQKQ